MGNDPYIPTVANDSQNGGSSATGNTIINHYSLTTGQLVCLVALSGIAFGMSIMTVVLMNQSHAAQLSQLDVVERRVMDRASIAEREARIAQDEIQRLQVQLKISTNH